MSRNWLSLTNNLSEIIQNDVTIGLNDIKKDFESKGLLFNERFRDHFYKCISNRLTETFEVFEIEKSTKSTEAYYLPESSDELSTSTDRLKCKRKLSKERTPSEKVTSKRRKSDDGIPSKWSFACAHCFSENDPNVWYGSEKQVHKHWQNTHETDIPFRFHVDCSVACFRCGLVESFERIRQHTFTAHLTRSIIIKNIRHPYRSGYDKTQDRSNEIHSLDALNPVPLSKRDLMELGAIGEHEFRCPHCKQSFKTKNEIKKHHRDKHPSKHQKYEKVEFICCLCQHNIPSTKFMAHVEECGIFKCDKCTNFRTNKPKLFLDHVRKMHPDELNAGFYSSVRRSLFHEYSAIKCIFANGLVVAQRNLAHSPYDIEKDFILLVADLVCKLRSIADSK